MRNILLNKSGLAYNVLTEGNLDFEQYVSHVAEPYAA